MGRSFCFRFDGELYQFTLMPLGLTTRPRVCTQLLSVVSFALAELGIRDVRYLDKFFFVAASEVGMDSLCDKTKSAVAVST